MTDQAVAKIEETTSLVPINPSAVLIAQTPAQLDQAQRQLVDWVQFRLNECETENKEYAENLEIAKKNRWRQSGLATAMRNCQKRTLFYVKAMEALKAGFYLIPNFPGDVFAIRTTRKKPKSKWLSTTNNFNTPYSKQETNSPPLGEGNWVSEGATMGEKQHEEPVKDKPGQTQTRYVRWNDGFDIVDFPYVLAKPIILKAATRAMAIKCFDEMGVLPGMKRTYGDPLIYGKIRMKTGSYRYKELTFLVNWFMELKDI